MSLLSARDLTDSFRTGGRDVRVVDGIDFDVSPGGTLGIVGESGSGKSMTSLAEIGVLPPGAVRTGRIDFGGGDLCVLTERRMRAIRGDRIAMVFQDPFSLLNPRRTVERIVTAPLRYQKRPIPGGTRAVARALLDRVGLDPAYIDRYPAQFSGGQAQRIGIVRVLAVSPRVLVCDEAVSALDVSVQAQIINLLLELQREEGFGCLFIAHDLAVVRQIATSVAVTTAGKIVEAGERDVVFDHPQHEYTRKLLAAVPRIRPEWEAARRQKAATR